MACSSTLSCYNRQHHGFEILKRDQTESTGIIRRLLHCLLEVLVCSVGEGSQIMRSMDLGWSGRSHRNRCQSNKILTDLVL